ncbi:hypothetical protein GGI17_001967 [Coemansia sp. S146]|nr:hypothetical protein GGI17_001967 [Coemansia sp. S146]
MSDNRSKVSANSKTSNSSRQPVLTYAETANNRSNRSTSSADATQAAPGTGAPATAAAVVAGGKHNQHRPSFNGANGSGGNNSGAASGAPAVGRGNNAAAKGAAAAVRSRSRDAPVRLPSRNSVSSAAAPAIQFGSLNQQARPPSPPAAQRAAPATAAATSGGVPAALAKPASKPSFGSIQSSSEDNAAKQPAGSQASSISSTADSSARPAQHGRQQQQHQQNQQQQHRPGSRSSSHSRQSQGFVPGRKDSGSFKHTGPKSGPKPHEQQQQPSEIPHHPPHYDGGYHVSQPPTMAMPGPPGPHPQANMGAQQQQQPHYANNPYRNQGHPHVRPPHSQGPGGPYKPQAGVHYAPHHMGGQPMSQPMGYGMPAPGQPPMQAPIMTTQPGMQPMAGWMAPPPHQFAYMPMGGPGYEQYYRASPAAGGPPPHNMYGMPNYSMPNPTHAMPSQIGAPGIMQGPMGGAPMPGMTASPMGGQHHHGAHGGLSANAQTFIPGGRRPVRIVNPNTNEEVDISQQRLRSVSTTSSTPQHAASGTASPAPGPIAERREPAATPVESVPAEDDAMPQFKIPSARKVNIVNPNLLPKPDTEAAKPKQEQPAVAVTEAPSTLAPATVDTAKQSEVVTAGTEPMDVDEKAEAPKVDALIEASQTQSKGSDVEAAAAAAAEQAEPKVEAVSEPAKPKEAESVDVLAESLSKATLVETVESATSAVETVPKEADSEPIPSVAAEDKPVSLSAGESPATQEEEQAEEEDEEENDEDVEDDENVEDYDETPAKSDDDGTEEGEIDEDDDENKSDTQRPPPLNTSRSRQVTFSEPPSATRRTLTPAEIIDLYSGQLVVPVIVGEILRYPRVFLDRFAGLCKPPPHFHFEIINTDERRSTDRGTAIRRSTSGSSRPRDPAPQSGFGGMGNFRHTQAPNPMASSEERFRQSTNELRGRMDGGRGGAMMGPRPPSGQFRGPGGGRESRGGRTSSTRGGRGGGRGASSGRGGRGGSQHGGDRSGPPLDMANVKPLEKSENRYIVKSLRIGKDAVEDEMQEEVFDRRMRVLLNKLTLDNFDTVSDELLTWGNKSVNETDGRVLRHLVMLVYQKAIDEPNWASMYARLCYKMFCDVDKKVEDRNLLTKDGKYLCGGFLVRKYLLTKCQEDFERGWKVEIPQDMESEEYYDAIKIKRRGLGLVRFICELFLLDILTVRIMHECVKRLLSNVETPEEEETESLAKLLTTVGKKLDKPEAKNYMDAYFVRIQAMSVNKHLTSRIRFMLKDVIELRKNGWVARMADAGPKTIAEIHEDVERKKQAEAAMRRAPSHPGRRADSHSGRGDGPGGRRAGWNTVGGPSGNGRNDQNQHVGDLSGFGNLSRSRQRATDASTPGSNPFGAFAGGSRGWSGASSDIRGKNRDERPRSLVLGPGGRTFSNSSRADSTAATPEPVGTRNMFDLLTNEEDEETHAPPRMETTKGPSKPTESKTAAPAKTMDTETMQRKIKGMIDEYMSLKDDVEFIECFKELGEINYQSAVFEITNNIMDRRPAHTEQVAKGVRALCTNNVLSEDTAVAGLAEYSELLEDMAIDAPNAYKFFGMLMAAVRVPLSRVAEALGDLATNLASSQPPAASVVFAYLKYAVDVDGEDKTKDTIAEAKFDVTQFLNKDKRSEPDVQSVLQSQDLLPLFPQFA